MTRRISRRVEIAELRDRAVNDALTIDRLRTERDTARAALARITAECDQATARADDLDSQVTILAAVCHQLGVTCIHPSTSGAVIVHIRATP